jgi:hypothetical protein
MIPELLHRFGDEASKWFTGSGLLGYKNVKWNPEKRTTSLAKESDSEELAEEDLWDITSNWEQINVNKASTRPDKAALDAPLARLCDAVFQTFGNALPNIVFSTFIIMPNVVQS